MRESGAPLFAVLGLASMLVGCSDDGLDSGSGANTQGTTAVGSSGDLGNTVTSGGSSETGAFETSSVDSDDTAVDSSGGGAFIYGAPDGGDQNFECDLVMNDCPVGEKCSPWANDGGEEWNATRCVPVAPEPAGPGEPCMVEGSPVSGFDDCAVGSVCLDVDPATLEGVCEPMCDRQLDTCPGPGYVCILYTPASVPLCTLECDPGSPDPGCAPGEICLEIEDFGICTEPD